jgi:hypothetical protein
MKVRLITLVDENEIGVTYGQVESVASDGFVITVGFANKGPVAFTREGVCILTPSELLSIYPPDLKKIYDEFEEVSLYMSNQRDVR